MPAQDPVATAGRPVSVVQREDHLEDRRDVAAAPLWPLLLFATVVAWLVGLAIPGLLSWLLVVPLLILAGVLGEAPRVLWLARRGRELLDAARTPPGVDQVAGAVADALHATGVSPVGSEGLSVVHEEDGRSWRVELDGVEEDVSSTFALALDQALAPLASPRYVVPRWVTLPGEPDLPTAVRVGRGQPCPAEGTVWHPVPDVLGANAARAAAYASAFDHWVGGGSPVLTASPEGQGVLAAQAGADPFSVSTTMRRTWD